MSRPFVIVESAKVLYALDQSLVREIVPARHITRLPGAPPAVRGILNVRGTLVTVVDLASRFGRGRAAAEELSVVIAVTESRTLGLLVDDVLDVQAYSADELVSAGAEPVERALMGMGHFGDRVVLAVDLQELAKQTLA